jgi:hypothetical protein
MSEPKGPDRIIKSSDGLWEIHEYDCEVIEDEEGMKKVMAWAAAKKAAEAKAAGAAAVDVQPADPDRPAA